MSASVDDELERPVRVRDRTRVRPHGEGVLRAGYNYGSNPVPENSLNPLLAAIAEHHVTFGGGYAFSPKWQVGTAVEYAFNNAVTYHNPELPFGPGAEAENEYIALTVHAEPPVVTGRETAALLTSPWWPVGNLSPIRPFAGRRIPPKRSMKRAAVGGPLLPARWERSRAHVDQPQAHSGRGCGKEGRTCTRTSC